MVIPNDERGAVACGPALSTGASVFVSAMDMQAEAVAHSIWVRKTEALPTTQAAIAALVGVLT